MGLRIKTNVESLIAQNRVSQARQQMSDSLEKLSSGQRINKSSDDAAGLAISESIRAKTKSLEIAKRNASDGISYIQVTEGGLNEITNIIIRMRELAAQSASDTLGFREREFLNREFQQLRQEINRIVDSTEFNGSHVLKLEDQKPMQIFLGASNRANDINGKPPKLDPKTDPDVITIDLKDLADLTKKLEVFRDDSLFIVPRSKNGGAYDLSKFGTNGLFNRLDNALNAIASFRATLGSVQSRLNSAITNIDVASENLQAAQSRIRDVDYAVETAKFIQSKILTQAGVSVLSHANLTPEHALALLR